MGTPATHGRKTLSGKQNKKKRTGGSQKSQTTARQEKRAQFEQPKSRTGLHLTLAGIALVAVGVIMFAVLRIRARRAEPEVSDTLDDAELQARLERFKKQTPDPPPSS